MYFCAFGLLLFIPLAYVICQILTWSVYEGRWRKWSLVPIPVTILTFTPLLFVQTPMVVSIVCLAAPAAGLVALMAVWFTYTRRQRRDAAARDVVSPDLER